MNGGDFHPGVNAMYKPLICSTKYHRLQIDDHETVENVKEEIRYLFTLHDNNVSHACPKTTHVRLHQLIQEPTVIFNIGRKLWCQAEDVLDSDSANVNIPDAHSHIVDLLLLTRFAFTRYKDDLPDCFGSRLDAFKRSVTQLTDLNASSAQKLTSPAVKQQDNPISQYFHLYLDVAWLLFTIDDARGVSDVKPIMTQLAFITYKTYERHKHDFITCKCLKSIWLRLQLFCENKALDFWGIFNAALECHNEEFVIRFLPFVAQLHCYNMDGVYVGVRNHRVRENFDFLSVKWNALIKNNIDDATLLGHMEAIDLLMLELWLNVARLDLLYSTWDHFYKKIEDISLDGELTSLTELVEGSSSLSNSYLFFLRILSRHFRRHPQHWNKFRGRIYTRFSNAKFAKLNDRGVFNLVLLLISISNVSFDEINGKILDFMDGLSHERKNTATVWKIYIMLIEVNLRHNKSIDNITSKFMPLIQEASTNRSQFHLVSLFASKLHAFTSSGTDMYLKQTMLLGTWIENYTKSCQHSELTNFLNVLVLMLETVAEAGAWFEYEKPFTAFVLPSLKRLALGPGVVDLVGTVAGLVVSNSTGDLVPAIAYFASENVPAKVMSAFFCTIGRNAGLPPEADPLILKAWFQCALIGESSADFTRFVFTLNVTSGLNMGPGDGLPEFLPALGAGNDKEVVKACFEGLEKWILKHLNSESVIQLIYIHMALIFTSCGHLLYSRSNITCPLSKFIDLLLLPTDVLRGTRPNDAVMRAIEKSWHVYVCAIYNLSGSDPYLERVLKDLIVRYIPHFQTKPTPLIKVLNDPNLAAAAITKINNEFLLQNANRNEFTYKVLSAINNLLENIGQLPNATLVVSKILPALFEVYMFKNQKLAAIDGVKLIVNSELFINGQLNDVFTKCLADTTKKHLPFNTNSYFQMMYVLTKIVPVEIRAILGDVSEEIKIVESKRGQGFDNCLRLGFDKLQKLLD